jgi:hypothetical protein
MTEIESEQQLAQQAKLELLRGIARAGKDNDSEGARHMAEAYGILYAKFPAKKEASIGTVNRSIA